MKIKENDHSLNRLMIITDYFKSKQETYKIPADRKLPIDKTDPSNQIKIGKSKIKYLPKLKVHILF